MENEDKVQECFRAAKYLKNLLTLDIKPRLVTKLRHREIGLKFGFTRDILTRNSFLNAVVIVNVLGGSTNAVKNIAALSFTGLTKVQVLHLLAMARAAEVDLTIDDFQMIADKTPFLADLMYVQVPAAIFGVDVCFRPSGRYYMEDVHNIGGIPAILKYLLTHTDLIDGTQLTVTGKTLAENLQDVPDINFEKQDVIRPLSNPIKPTGHITILRGSLAPDSAVAKLTGKEGLKFEVMLVYQNQNLLLTITDCRVLQNVLIGIASYKVSLK